MISIDPCYLSAGEALRCFVDGSLSPVEARETLRLGCAALAWVREFDPPRWSLDPRLTEGE